MLKDRDRAREMFSRDERSHLAQGHIFTSHNLRWLSSTWWNQSLLRVSLNAGASVFKLSLNRASFPSKPSNSLSKFEFVCNFNKLTNWIGKNDICSLRLAHISTVSLPLAERMRPIWRALSGEKYSISSLRGIFSIPFWRRRSLMCL